MTGWLRTGKIFAKMRDAGLGVAVPPDGALDRDAQDELAGETVAAALHRFHHEVLLRGQWKPAKGARLTTFFVGQCKLRFANIYRAWLDKELASEAAFDPTDVPPGSTRRARRSMDRSGRRSPGTTSPTAPAPSATRGYTVP